MKNVLTAIILVAGGFSIGSTMVIISASRNQVKSSPVKIVCDSGNEFADEKLIRDPYYAYSWKCNVGDVNGPQVIVEVID